MKKFLSVILSALLICTVCASTAFATDGVEETIEFVYEEEISDELKARVEHAILHGDSNGITRGILCTIFGHDLITTTTDKITHKAYSTQPRCLRETYEVETCEDCDYSKSTLINSEQIFCCS